MKSDFYIPNEAGARLIEMATRNCNVPLELWNKCGSLAKWNHISTVGIYGTGNHIEVNAFSYWKN